MLVMSRSVLVLIAAWCAAAGATFGMLLDGWLR
jgi:hypothetical protein